MATRYARFHADELYFVEDIAAGLETKTLDVARRWIHEHKIPGSDAPGDRQIYSGRHILIAIERDAVVRPRRGKKSEEED